MSIGAIVCGRNDDFKDDKRCLICLNSFIEEMDEVIYVDWNSPGESLIEKLRPRLKKTGKLRAYTVSNEVAISRIQHFPDFPVMCDVLAKNIGTRRAKSDWIINTNIDLIAPNKERLLEVLTNPNTFYVIARRNIDKNIVYHYGLDRWKECRDYLETIQGPSYFLDAAMGIDERYSMINCCGDVQIAHRNVWHNLRGYEEGMVYRNGTDGNAQLKAVKHGFDLQLLFEPQIYHIEHNKVYQQGNANKVDGNIKVARYNNLHLWMEHFETTLNHNLWGCAEIEFPVEII